MALHPAPTLRACVREGLKTWRKCNAAMVLATQTVEDFASAETSEPRMQTAVPTAVGARVPERTEAISPGGPLHRLLEGTLIDTVLTNPLDGSGTAPVNCLVTNAVYSHIGRRVVIPAGARVLGTTRPVRTLGETRLAVTLHLCSCPTAARIDWTNSTAEPDRRRRPTRQGEPPPLGDVRCGG